MFRTKTALGIIRLWFNYLLGPSFSSFKALGIHFSREAKERNKSVIVLLLSVSSCVWRWSLQFANLSLPFQNASPSDTRFNQKVSSVQGYEQFRSHCIAAFNFWTARKTSAAVMVFSFPRYTPPVCLMAAPN